MASKPANECCRTAGGFDHNFTLTDMSVDLAKAVGHPSKDKPVSWNQRDLLTYAVGVGAKAKDLPVVYGAWRPVSLLEF